MRKGGIPSDQLQKTNFYADKGKGDDDAGAALGIVGGSPNRNSPGRKKKKKKKRNNGN